MNKLYFIVPVVGLLAFYGYFRSFNEAYEAKKEAIRLQQEEDRKAKIRQEIENREKAIQAAIEAQARRKAEREERERIEEKKKADRAELEDRREKAFSDRNRLADQARRLKRDLDEVQAEVTKIEAENKALVSEQEFLRKYVKQAEGNAKYYYDLLDKIAQAEKARADAAAAAAAAKKG